MTPTLTTNKEYLIHLICASTYANASVIGLLVFANPQAPLLKSPRTNRTPLQVALCRHAPVDVITLLFEFETNKTAFCQEKLDNGLVPLQLLLQPVQHNACLLREDNARHSMFMKLVNTWTDGLQHVDTCWRNYYHIWRHMDELAGRAKTTREAATTATHGTQGKNTKLLFHHCFSSVLTGTKGKKKAQSGTKRRQRSSIGTIDVVVGNDTVTEGIHNLLTTLSHGDTI